MTSGLVSSISAIIMAFFTLISSLFGIAANRPATNTTQDFEPKSQEEIRIMSFNIRCTNVGTDSWQDRIGIVTDTMLNSEADSIGVQEATPEWMTTLKETTKEKYASVGIGRDGEGKGEHSAIFYLKDKYSVVDSGTFWLSETPEQMSKGWDASLRRICTWAVLENKQTGKQFVHMNSHFDHIGVAARRNSVSLICDRAKNYSHLPVVFTADMNVTEGTENYTQFVNSGVFRDTKYDTTNSMSNCTYHDTKPEKNRNEVIDYVMINSHFKAQSYRVVTAGIDGRFVSDHYPVYADITFA